MSRKRTQSKSQKKTKKPENQTVYLIITGIIIIVAITALIFLQNPADSNPQNENNQTNGSQNQGTWLFAMDTRDEYVGGFEEYSTGYIPTLVIIDIDGNIVYKSAGVHSKDELLQHVRDAENSSSERAPAPTFTLETIYGSQFRLSDHQGTPVILDFMAVRCPPCKSQMPELQKLKKELGDDVVILSIDVDGAGGYESAQDVIDTFGEYIKEE